MTVINNNARNQYVATLGQTIFNYTFEIAANTDIKVYKRAASASPNDTTDILVLTTDYSVTGVGVNTGGTIVLVSGAAVGDWVTIQGAAPPARSTSFTPNGVIAAQNLNLEFDNDVLIYQTILATQNYLVPKYPKSAYVQAFELILPNLPANKVWQMNSTGTAIIASTLLSGEDLASHAAGLGASLIGLHPTGTVQDLANAGFILKTANAAAPNAQALGALGNGIMKNATASGIVSISPSLTSLDSLTTAADQMAYSSGVNTWSLTALTAFARSLLDDANAAAARTTLGVPSTSEAFLIANNLSEGDPATMRTNLGLVIGTNVQAYDATLQSLSALGTAANKVAYTTGVDTWAEVTATAYSRGLWAGIDLAAWQVALGIPGGGGSYFAIANNLSEGVPATMRTNLGLVIGTNVQAFDATLQSLSALGTASDKLAYTTGVDTWAETGITALGRSLIDDATQADMNVTIGSVPLAGGTMSGALYLSGAPLTGSQAATKDYVDAVSRNFQIACLVAQTTDMPTWTYANGASGVGATLTAPINGATTFDTSIVPVNGDRILVLFQTTNPAWQGAYSIVQGTAGTPTVLTRVTDWDVAAQMNPGDIFSVVAGTAYGATQWMFSQTAAITVGTTALTFTQVTGQGALLKANNLSDLINVATARTNLGLVIGTNVQAQDATLQSISGLGTGANKMIYTTALDTWVEADITALGRTLVADATAADMRITMGLVIGTNVAAAGANGDITSMTGLTGSLRAPTAIQSSAGLNALTFTYTASAVNYLTITNRATGGSPHLTATGSDSAVQLSLGAKNSNVGIFDTTGTIAPALIFYNAATTFFTALKAATAQATSLTLTLPAVDAAVSGYPLVSNAAGVLTFSATPNIGAATATSITFSPTTGGIVGTTTNDDAAAGKVGEYVTSLVAVGSAVSLTSTTTKTVTSISLTAGDWDVFGLVGFTGNAATTITQTIGDINTVTNTLSTDESHYSIHYPVTTTGEQPQQVVPYQRISLSGTTTIYLIARSVFSVNTLSAFGRISARRVR